MTGLTKFPITAEDICRAIEFQKEVCGNLPENFVLNLGVTKFGLNKNDRITYFYRLGNGKMGFYYELMDCIKVYEVKDNEFWVNTLTKEDFMLLFGNYIDMVQPQYPNEIEAAEEDDLTMAIDKKKNDMKVVDKSIRDEIEKESRKAIVFHTPISMKNGRYI